MPSRIWRSQDKAEKVLMMVNAMGMRKNQGNKKRSDRMRQCIFTRFFMLFDWECHSEKYYGKMVNSSLWIFVNNQKYSRRNKSFGKLYKFYWNESDQCKNMTGLSSANGPSLNQSEMHPTSSNTYEYNYQWQHILNGQYFKISINAGSTIFGLVSMVIGMWFGHYYEYLTYWQHLYATENATKSLPQSDKERP